MNPIAEHLPLFTLAVSPGYSHGHWQASRNELSSTASAVTSQSLTTYFIATTDAPVGVDGEIVAFFDRGLLRMLFPCSFHNFSS